MLKELINKWEAIKTNDITSDKYCEKMAIQRQICEEICKNTGLEYKKVGVMFNIYKTQIVEMIKNVEVA